MYDLKNPGLGEITQKLKKDLELIPSGLKIATMTIISKFDTTFNLLNIGKYIDLHEDGIVKVKFGDAPDQTRSLYPEKPSKRRQKKTKKAFYNQTSLHTHLDGHTRKVNMKLFKNGTVHFTGCKTINDYEICIRRLCRVLSVVKATVPKVRHEPVTLRPFVGKPANMCPERIVDVNIALINSNFKVNFKIDRDRLHKLLNDKRIKNNYESCVHAAVIIKYNYQDRKEISILVFESGAIIVTGAKNGNHVSRAYRFITDFLDDHRHTVAKYNIDSFLKDPKLRQLMAQKPDKISVQ